MSTLSTPPPPSTSELEYIWDSDPPTPPPLSTSEIYRNCLLPIGAWPGDDDLPVCAEDEPIDPSKCYLLQRIPIEIRKEIYRELFYRPVTITPRQFAIRFNIVRAYRCSDNVHRYFSYASERFIYKYCWDDVRDERPDDDTGDGNSSDWDVSDAGTTYYSQPVVDVRKTWITAATEEDIKWCNENDTADLPDVVDGDRHITRHIHHRPHFNDQVINETFIPVAPLHSLELLRTCKQIYEEATDILYGDNCFCLDLGGEKSNYRTVHRRYELIDETPSRIPGLSNKDGMPSSTQDLSRALGRLFSKRYQPNFNYRDPLLRFFFQIGHHNASKLTNVKIKGILKAAQVDNEPSGPSYSSMGLVPLLSIYTATLRSVCTKLRKLDLSIFVRKPKAGEGLTDWVVDQEGEDSDEEKIYLTVATVVHSLPSLTELYLGHTYPHDFYDRYRDDWERSVECMKVVRERSTVPQADLEKAAAELGLHQVKVHQPSEAFKGETLELYKEKKCFFCKVEGHLERNCPERKKKFKRSKKPKKSNERATRMPADGVEVEHVETPSGRHEGSKHNGRAGHRGGASGRAAGRGRGKGFAGREKDRNGSDTNAAIGEAGENQGTRGTVRRGRGGRRAGRGRARGKGFSGRGKGHNGSNENATIDEGGNVIEGGGSGSSRGKGRRDRGGRGGRDRSKRTQSN